MLPSLQRWKRFAPPSDLSGAGRKCLMPSSVETMVADTKWILVMHQFALKSTPAKKPLKYSSRRISRRAQKGVDALPSSRSRATFLAKPQELQRGAQHLKSNMIEVRASELFGERPHTLFLLTSNGHVVAPHTCPRVNKYHTPKIGHYVSLIRPKPASPPRRYCPD